MEFGDVKRYKMTVLVLGDPTQDLRIHVCQRAVRTQGRQLQTDGDEYISLTLAKLRHLSAMFHVVRVLPILTEVHRPATIFQNGGLRTAFYHSSR